MQIAAYYSEICVLRRPEGEKPRKAENEKAFKKTNDYETFRKPNLDNGYENFKKHILTSIGSSQVKAWLDNLHCLRRPNGSYILDHEGNPIICSPNNFAQLLKDKIVVQALEQ